MMLMTKEILGKLPPLYTHEKTKPEEVPVGVKFFDPCGRMTYYVTEYDPEDRLCYGWMVSPLGPDCDEWGYVSMEELEGVRNAFGLGIERDTGYGYDHKVGEVLN